MSEVQTFLYLGAVNPSNIESRLKSCLILNTDLKTEECAVLMNFLELTIFTNDWWDNEGAQNLGIWLILGEGVCRDFRMVIRVCRNDGLRKVSVRHWYQLAG